MLYNKSIASRSNGDWALTEATTLDIGHAGHLRAGKLPPFTIKH